MKRTGFHLSLFDSIDGWHQAFVSNQKPNQKQHEVSILPIFTYFSAAMSFSIDGCKRTKNTAATPSTECAMCDRESELQPRNTSQELTLIETFHTPTFSRSPMWGWGAIDPLYRSAQEQATPSVSPASESVPCACVPSEQKLSWECKKSQSILFIVKEVNINMNACRIRFFFFKT